MPCSDLGVSAANRANKPVILEEFGVGGLSEVFIEAKRLISELRGRKQNGHLPPLFHRDMLSKISSAHWFILANYSPSALSYGHGTSRRLTHMAPSMYH